LIQEVINANKKISPEKVVAIWNIPNRNIPGISQQLIWLEKGTPSAGLEHIVANHGREFEQHGITTEKLPELVEAVLRVGWFDGQRQGKTSETPRPVVVLNFPGTIIPVAITCADNSFIIGMNPKGWDDYRKDHGVTEDEVKEVASWPLLSSVVP
jgi:hypothetical protein